MLRLRVFKVMVNRPLAAELPPAATAQRGIQPAYDQPDELPGRVHAGGDGAFLASRSADGASKTT